MLDASGFIFGIYLPIYKSSDFLQHRTEQDYGKTCLRKDENDNLKTRPEMDVRRCREYEEESKITRKEI